MTPVLVPQLPVGYEDVPHTVNKLSARRRAIARNMEVSAAVPTLTADVQIDLTQMVETRALWNGETRPSVMACVAKAAIDALSDFPTVNSTYSERHLLQWKTVNLSVAVDSPGGLLTPVVRDAQRLPVEELTTAVAEIASKARDGKLSPEDMTAGTFTLSNPGAVGPCLRAEALLNPPQVALLGLPGLRRLPLVIGEGNEERVEVRTVVEPSLTFDHRVLDGGDAVRYLVALRDRLQRWTMEDYQLTR